MSNPERILFPGNIPYCIFVTRSCEIRKLCLSVRFSVAVTRLTSRLDPDRSLT